MRIKAITASAINLKTVQNVQRNSAPAQVNNNMSAPQCKVTISEEGKKLSNRQTEQSVGNAQKTAVRKRMLRQDEESEQNEKTLEGYREQLGDIQKQITSINRSFSKETNKEIIKDELEVIMAIRKQKQAQLEENQRRAKEARELAMQSSKYQEDIDGNNRKLWTLLKTLEEAEKAEEEREGVSAEDNNPPEAEISAGDTIHNSAAQFIAASMGRDLYVDGKLRGLIDEGHQFIDLANTITSNILEESKYIMAALDDDSYPDDMKAELMDHFQKEAMQSYNDVEKYRGYGLDILQDTRDHKIKRIADDPLAGMQETKGSMMMSAADAILGEARQSHLDEASKELEDEVQRLIDRRNDVDRISEDEDEENEEAEAKVEDSEEPTDAEVMPEEKFPQVWEKYLMEARSV